MRAESVEIFSIPLSLAAMEPTVIPQLFALFDDEATDRQPFFQNRFILLWRRSGLMNRLDLVPYPFLAEGEYATLERNGFHSVSRPVHVGSHQHSKWWNTGFSLHFHGAPQENHLPIPVIDFLHRSELPGNIRFNLTAMNDEDTWCFMRQVDQRVLRSRIQDNDLERRVNELSQITFASAATAPAVAPIPPPAAPQQKARAAGPLPQSGVPKYILEAFVRDAQAQKQTCPITCVEPRECGTVLVTNCFHWFESTALKRWRESKNQCPVCKAEIQSTTEVKV